MCLTNDQPVSAAENEGKTTGKVRGIYEIGNLSLPKLLEAIALQVILSNKYYRK